MFKVDNKVTAQEFKPLPNGVYPCVIIESEVKEDDEYGTQFEFTFVVDRGAYHRKRIWGRHVFIPGAKTKPVSLEINTSLLKDIFYVADQKGFESIDEARELAHNFVGVELFVAIKTQQSNGKDYTNPTLYYKTDGSLRASDSKYRKPLDVEQVNAGLGANTSDSVGEDLDVPF